MNKLIVSMGLAATGAAFQMNCLAQSSPVDSSKDWNVSAALRGFYDSNYGTDPDSPNKKGSYGVELSPTVSANVPFTQTQLGVYYSYDLQYYQERDHLNQDPYDQSHTFNFWLDHAFNEDWNTKVNDSFVVGQEPDLLLNGGTANATYARLNGNNINNNASILLHTDWSRLLSTELTYGNVLSYYSQEGSQQVLNPGPPPSYSVSSGGLPNQPSYAGALNSEQNSLDLKVQWHLAPETTLSVGYQFIDVIYTGNEDIAVWNDPVTHAPVWFKSDSRDNLSHIAYLGVQHNLLPDLTVAAKAGFQYNDAYNNPVGHSTDTTPYADVSIIYTYLPGCNAQIGFTQARNSTYLVSVNQANGSLTQDQESSTVHASVNHHITQKLLVTAIGSWSGGTYKGGGFNDQTTDDYELGLSANYSFTRNISGEIDYNYDDVSSNVPGFAYNRNRVSIGMTVAY